MSIIDSRTLIDLQKKKLAYIEKFHSGTPAKLKSCTNPCASNVKIANSAYFASPHLTKRKKGQEPDNVCTVPKTMPDSCPCNVMQWSFLAYFLIGGSQSTHSKTVCTTYPHAKALSHSRIDLLNHEVILVL